MAKETNKVEDSSKKTKKEKKSAANKPSEKNNPTKDNVGVPEKTSISDTIMPANPRGYGRDPTEVGLAGNFVIIPPDGGWGWVIVICAFIATALTDSMLYCFGLFISDIGIDFEVAPTAVSIASSVMTAEINLLGPLVCSFANRCGFRIVAITGSVLTVVAFATASFAPNLILFILTAGMLSGAGMSMLFITSVMVVSFYFERWRALATAIAVTGSSVGTILMPVVVRALDNFTWRQQFQIISAGISLCVLCALTYKPIVPTEVHTTLKEDRRALIDRLETMSNFSQTADSSTKSLYLSRFRNRMIPTSANLIHGFSDIQSFTQYMHNRNEKSKASAGSLKMRTSIGGRDMAHQLTKNSQIPKDSNEDQPKCKCTLNFWRSLVHCDFDCCHRKLAATSRRHILLTRPLYRDDILYAGNLKRLAQYQENPPTEKHRPSISYHMSVTRMLTLEDIEELSSNKCKCCPQPVLRILATMFDLELFKKLTFVIMMISGFFAIAGQYAPYIYLIEMNREFGNEEAEATFLISVIGLTNLVGRVLCGLISVTPKITGFQVMEVCLVISGCSIICLPIFTSITMQYIFCGIFGLTISVTGALRSIVLVELFGLENLTNAFGIAVMFQGFACIVGLPLTGILRDVTGAYLCPMIFSGSCILISGLIMIPIHYITYRERCQEYASNFNRMQQLELQKQQIAQSSRQAN